MFSPHQAVSDLISSPTRNRQRGGKSVALRVACPGFEGLSYKNTANARVAGRTLHPRMLISSSAYLVVAKGTRSPIRRDGLANTEVMDVTSKFLGCGQGRA